MTGSTFHMCTLAGALKPLKCSLRTFESHAHQSMCTCMQKVKVQLAAHKEKNHSFAARQSFLKACVCLLLVNPYEKH